MVLAYPRIPCPLWGAVVVSNQAHIGRSAVHHIIPHFHSDAIESYLLLTVTLTLTTPGDDDVTLVRFFFSLQDDGAFH